ncbi:hypothetical protein [Polaromonas sp. CG9_12]|nr:hypothetical protein [Polaromonas sp. CG9_12]
MAVGCGFSLNFGTPFFRLNLAFSPCCRALAAIEFVALLTLRGLAGQG